MNKETKTVELEQAKKLLEEEEQKKREICIREIEEVLKKHNYKLEVVSSIIIKKNG